MLGIEAYRVRASIAICLRYVEDADAARISAGPLRGVRLPASFWCSAGLQQKPPAGRAGAEPRDVRAPRIRGIVVAYCYASPYPIRDTPKC